MASALSWNSEMPPCVRSRPRFLLSLITLSITLTHAGGARAGNQDLAEPNGDPRPPVTAAAPMRPHEVPRSIFLDRSGAPELVVSSAINGVMLGSFVTQAIFGDSDPDRAASGTLLGAGIGIALPLVLLHRQPVHAGQASYYALGQRWGTVNGLLLPLLWSSGRNQSWQFATSVGVLSASGLLATIFTYPEFRPSPGQVSALGTAHTFSTIGVALLTLMLDVVPESGATFAAPVLLLSNASMGAAWLLRDNFDVDRRRLIWTDVGGYVGLGVGLGVGLMAVGKSDFPQREQVFAASMLAGMGAGMALGFFFSEGLDTYRNNADRSRSEVLNSTLPVQPEFDWSVGGPRVWALGSERGSAGSAKMAWGLNLLKGSW